MTSKSHFIPNFELRSIALLTALTIGAALAAQAQTTDSGGAKHPGTPTAPSTLNTPPRTTSTAPSAEAIFARADANKDGKLSRQEASRIPAVEQRFDDIDTNKDQFVSREEFESAIKS